ncbi:MAG TPA: SHOCT domain-containing protein, partial [Acidimicrobiales bacterium]|nr:SHOCT domain-containing protein [Acidimicrobiales bacterium]
HQNLFDRLLRVGNVYIEVPGRTGVVVYQCLRRPEVVQRIISEQTAALYRQGTGAGPSAGYGAGHGAGYGADQGAGHGTDLGTDFHHTPPAGTPAVRSPTAGAWAPSAAGGTGASGSVVDAMAQLDELRRRGLLSEVEYADKKAELLRRL